MEIISRYVVEEGTNNEAHIIMPKQILLLQKRHGKTGSGLVLLSVMNHCQAKNMKKNGTQQMSKGSTKGDVQEDPSEAYCRPVANSTQLPRSRNDPIKSTLCNEPQRALDVRPSVALVAAASFQSMAGRVMHSDTTDSTPRGTLQKSVSELQTGLFSQVLT